jgi:hypothetical protein
VEKDILVRWGHKEAGGLQGLEKHGKKAGGSTTCSCTSGALVYRMSTGYLRPGILQKTGGHS